jgi:hypothetical protein
LWRSFRFVGKDEFGRQRRRDFERSFGVVVRHLYLERIEELREILGL